MDVAANHVKKAVVDEFFSPLRRRFPRRKTIQRGINDTWQMDLSILESFAKFNDGFKYLLCVIDIFTKFAYVKPLKTKNGREVAKNIQADQGREFWNKQVKALLRKHNINLYHSYNKEIKAAMVERFQRTLKTRLWKLFTINGSYRYLGILQGVADDYDNTPHSGIGNRKPNSIKTKRTEKELLQTVYNRIKTFTKGKFSIGDFVRIADHRGLFDKGYEYSHICCVQSKFHQPGNL